MPVVTSRPTAPLEAELDRLCDVDPAALGERGTIVELHRQLARLEAVVAGAVAAFDVGREWEADGARSAAAWVATRCHVPSALARRRVRLGRALRSMALVEAAWRAGQLNDSQVAVLAGARGHHPEFFARDEQVLVTQARQLRYDLFVRAVAYWVQRADPDGAEQRTAAAYRARRFHLSPDLAGNWAADGYLDAIGGSVLDKTLREICQELFRDDWAEAKARVGEEVCAADLRRSPAQRRADALVEMARRAGAVPAGARMPEPLFSVVMGLPELYGVCELWNGTVVTPGGLVRWLDEATVERIVFDGPSRVLDVGVRRRFFSGATRRAIEVRDRRCTNEFCDVPAEECQIDHVTPYSEGGPTTTANGRPACDYHNRWNDQQRRGPPQRE